MVEPRGFTCVEDMDEAMIKDHNSVVTPNDIVFDHGDFCFGNKKWVNEVLSRLNGRICLIRGNHDLKVIRGDLVNRFMWVKDVHMETIHGKFFHMSHYAHLVWNKSHYGSYHTFGHSHNSLNSMFTDTARRMDCGVDTRPRKADGTIDATPYSFEEVQAYMEARGLFEIDHHKGKDRKY